MNSPDNSSLLSWVSHDLPSLTVFLPQGMSCTWPVHMLLGFEIHPGKSGGPECMVLQLGERLVVVHGYRLRLIGDDLAAACGGYLSVQNARYTSVADPEQAFVTEVEVSLLRDLLTEARGGGSAT